MAGKFLKRADLREARKQTEVLNARLKRGEVKDSDKIVRTHHIACGCGAPGCVFISIQRVGDDKSNN